MKLVVESTETDTSDDWNIGFNDILSFPEFLVQDLKVGIASQAYAHGPVSSSEYDLDMFTFVLDAGETYQIRVSSEFPSLFPHGVTLYSEYSYQGGAMSRDEAGFSFIFSTLQLAGQFVLKVPISSTTTLEGNTPYEIVIKKFSAEPAIPRSDVEKVALLYEAALDRKPDTPGLNYWVSNLGAGKSVLDIADSFARSAEFTSKFDVTTNATFIDQLYLNVLGRSADQDGTDYWLAEMDNGHSRSNVLLGFAESSENRNNAVEWVGGLRYEPAIDMWMI